MWMYKIYYRLVVPYLESGQTLVEACSINLLLQFSPYHNDYSKPNNISKGLYFPTLVSLSYLITFSHFIRTPCLFHWIHLFMISKSKSIIRGPKYTISPPTNREIIFDSLWLLVWILNDYSRKHIYVQFIYFAYKSILINF